MIDRSEPFTSDLAVIYLARHAEGVAPIARFSASYRRHPAGIAHDLIIVRKGFPDDSRAFDAALQPLQATSFSISDDGFDISAYAEAASKLPHRRIVCLNTFSEIAGDDWLRKLDDALNDDTIGAAGATGSYESPRTSMRRLKTGLFLAQRQFAPSLSRLRGAFQLVRRLLPKHLSRFLVNRLIARMMTPRAPTTGASFPQVEFEEFWTRETKADGTYDYFNAVPEFPNPHLRTNGFIINRKLFLDLVPAVIASKEAAYLFESGPDSMTAQILRRGLRVLVVGRDGTSYDVDRWPHSRTFRLGDQSNLLLHDNQTRAFADMDKVGRAAFTAMAWGDEAS